MLASEHLDELKVVCAGATVMNEAGQVYIHLPGLKLPGGCNPQQQDALLWLSGGGAYPTRLFLAQPVGRGANWSTQYILGKTWHTWSWKDVATTLRPMEVLAEHLRGLR